MYGNPEPSPNQVREGVETEWQASLWDEETVRTTNSKEVAKAIVACITDWSLVQIQPGPPSYFCLCIVIYLDIKQLNF